MKNWDRFAWVVLLCASVALGAFMTGCGGQAETFSEYNEWCCLDSNAAECVATRDDALEWLRHQELSGLEGACYLMSAQ